MYKEKYGINLLAKLELLIDNNKENTKGFPVRAKIFTSPSGSAGCSPFRASTSLPACRWISSFLVAWPYRQMDSCLA